MKTPSILSLIFLVSCSHYDPHGDKEIKKKDAPSFLLEALPKNEAIQDVKFYTKTRKGIKTFEVKYEVKDKEISIKMNDKGAFLEREEDIDFSDLTPHQGTKIKDYFSGRFKKFDFIELERRTDESQKKLIDVEAATSDTEKPFLEISFDENGDYVSEKIEHVEAIRTLR